MNLATSTCLNWKSAAYGALVASWRSCERTERFASRLRAAAKRCVSSRVAILQIFDDADLEKSRIAMPYLGDDWRKTTYVLNITRESTTLHIKEACCRCHDLEQTLLVPINELKASLA